jgi:proline dehydrogenase
MERSAREKFCFAAKLVRGAYMYSERELAEEEGRESPIHDSLDDTHASYDRNMESVLKYIRNNKNRAEVMFATHNSRSVKFAVRCMQDWDIPRESVYFGQLLGMADNITFPLGSSGYNVYKYVPYGPINEVMPYLIRRAQENSDLLGGVSLERDMLFKELKSRFAA